MVDAVIAGAGIAGIASAWRMAERRGSSDAILVDPFPPLAITSNRPEANFRDWWPQPAMADLAELSLGFVDALRSDGARIPGDRRGYLYVTNDAERASTMPAIVATRAQLGGGGADLVDGPTLRGECPYLSPAAQGAIRVRRAGSLDTVALGRAMLERAMARGVTVVRGSVTAVEPVGGHVAGVTIDTAAGPVRYATSCFVNAAGPFANRLVGLVGASLRIETVLRQKVMVQDVGQVVPPEAPFTIFVDGQTLPWSAADRRRLERTADGRRLLEPLPGGIHVKPDTSAGPQRIKLGWAWDQTPMPAVTNPAIPPEFPRMVLLGATVAIPALARYVDDPAAVVGHDGGFYARVPDGQPLVGPLGPEGSFIVGALAGFGAMMAAGAGDVLASWLLGEAPSERMRAFAPRRFEDPAYLAAIRQGGVQTGEL